MQSYLIEDDSTSVSYIPFFQDEYEQMFAIPEQIVFNLRPESIDRFYSMKLNATASINCSKTLKDFVIFDRMALDSELVRDKIVIFGYLGPEDYDVRYIRRGNSKEKTYAAVITANIVLDLLSRQHAHSLDR